MDRTKCFLKICGNGRYKLLNLLYKLKVLFSNNGTNVFFHTENWLYIF